MQKIVAVVVKPLLELTRATLSQLENIVRNLLLKRTEIQHRVSYICTSINMVIMENLLLVTVLELFMKNMKKYYVKKQCLNLILINVKHFIKLWGEKRREEYTGLDMKQKSTMGRIFLSQHLYHLQFLNQHQQQIWMSLSNK